MTPSPASPTVDLLELQHAAGPRHPWEVARLAFFERLARRAGVVGAGVAVLDVGAGDGWVARELLRRGLAGQVTCWDTGYTPTLLARHGLADQATLHFVAERPLRRFDLILLLDVLEHAEDDAGLLGALVAENLAPGGHALLSAPAWPALFSAHDTRLRHKRRYRPAALRALARQAGLRIERAGGLFHSLLLARALGVLRERLAPVHSPPAASAAASAAAPAGGAPGGVEGWRAPAPVSAAVGAALAADTALTSLLLPLGLSLPGLSTWALCTRPSR